MHETEAIPQVKTSTIRWLTLMAAQKGLKPLHDLQELKFKLLLNVSVATTIFKTLVYFTSNFNKSFSVYFCLAEMKEMGNVKLHKTSFWKELIRAEPEGPVDENGAPLPLSPKKELTSF